MIPDDAKLLRALLAETDGRMLKEVLAENRMYWHTEANRTRFSAETRQSSTAQNPGKYLKGKSH